MGYKKRKILYEKYDYEEEYNKQIKREESYDDLRLNSNYVYARKTITSGNMVEVEIYPVWKDKSNVPRGKRKEPSRKVQENLNKKNRTKNIVRLVNANFVTGDLYMTLTYSGRKLPNEDRARKDIKNYIAKVRRFRKKHNIKEELKYIYVIGFENDPDNSKRVRIHHHLIMSKMDRDEAEKLWTMGRAEARRLQPDEFEFEGVARYMANQSEKRMGTSLNLKKPTITIDRTTLTRRKAENLAVSEYIHKEYFESKYTSCTYLDCNTYQSEEWPGVYIYARLRKGEGSNEIKK